MELTNNIKILRSVIRELRKVPQLQVGIKDSSVYQYIMNLYRQNAVTELQYCREQQEMEFMARTFLTYLTSSRKLKYLHEEYHGKGERSLAETARIVGFKMPNEPR